MIIPDSSVSRHGKIGTWTKEFLQPEQQKYIHISPIAYNNHIIEIIKYKKINEKLFYMTKLSIINYHDPL